MELIREIIVPTSNAYVLNLPDEMIGKQVEVIAFEIEKPDQKTRTEDPTEDISKIRNIFKNSLIDLSSYKFDRDQANHYDE